MIAVKKNYNHLLFNKKTNSCKEQSVKAPYFHMFSWNGTSKPRYSYYSDLLWSPNLKQHLCTAAPLPTADSVWSG